MELLEPIQTEEVEDVEVTTEWEDHECVAVAEGEVEDNG